MTNEVLNLAGVAPGTLWGTVRKDPKQLGAIYAAYQYLVMRQVFRYEKYLKRTVRYNAHGCYKFITTTKDALRYIRELGVHGKKVSVTSSRRQKLVAQYNVLSPTQTKALSDLTHNEVAHDNFFGARETNMNEAPSFFDAAEVAPVLLLFGGWGPLIFGNDWDRTLQEQGEEAAALSKDFFEGARLPSTLTRAQQLSLKPVTRLASDELAYLEAERGDTVNPLVRYFEPLDPKPRSSGLDVTRDASPMLVFDSPLTSLASSRCVSPILVDDARLLIW
ncbi:hypothetical protein B0H15DRAFT_807004 [Mycena belliarum]|uniref:Uncharacterized protein n=1 Tax=Mycena belliarum TaxID=1033014 RepID=A0AAD6TPV5_9AGAR|nr:hypothetical protein B0H15DRAFT_807004 [Mycena belliae]